MRRVLVPTFLAAVLVVATAGARTAGPAPRQTPPALPIRRPFT